MADVYSSEDTFLRDYNKLTQEYKNKAGRYIKNLLKLQRAENGLDKEIQKHYSEPTEKYDEKELYCSFCGKPVGDCNMLITAPAANICDECVDACDMILEEAFLPDEESNEQSTQDGENDDGKKEEADEVGTP